jgi:NTE family protein
VIASASIPVLFKPVIIDDIYYVDGGVMDNLPVSPIENKCSFIIGSSVNPTGYEKTVTSMVQIAERSFMLNMTKEVVLKASRFDIFIAPEELKNYKILDPQKAIEVYNIGYKETKRILEEPETQNVIRERLS